MKQDDKTFVKNISEALLILPPDKREYLLGVADGMAAMATMATAPPSPGTERPSA